MKEIKDNKYLSSGSSILLFSTGGCNPCKNMKTILEKFEKLHGDKIKFYNIDVENNPLLASDYKIKSVPTTVFVKENKIKDRFAGFIDNIDLESKMMNLLFDIDEEVSFGFEEF